MAMVLLVWLLQLGAVVFFTLMNASFSTFLDRLRDTFLRPSVAVMATGCFVFLLIMGQAVAQQDPVTGGLASLSFLIEALMLVVSLVRAFFAGRRGPDFTFGSAAFATPAHATERGLVGESGIRLGRLRHPDPAQRGPETALPLHYTGERHLLTVAPTRSGKGVSSIIPNLLTYPGSCIVIDPKGENALITHERRSKIGRSLVIDPWSITGLPVARFNPLDLLVPNSPTLIEDATLIAEALVVPDGGDNAAHFNQQAADLIKGSLLYLATAAGEVKTLGRLRAILTSPPASLIKLAVVMSKSAHPVVASAAAQIAGKNEKEWLSIVSTAQRHTHFLDSPNLQANLAASDFRFADLKGDQPVSIYLVLPVDRLSTHSRWLRMVVALGIASLARTPKKPKRPVYFVLDEMAALGRMAIIEDAYGLMAGLGLMLHAIFQDLNQAERVYGAGWQTFVGNSGAIQVFGTRDMKTAEYFSNLAGVTTQTQRGESTTSNTSNGQGLFGSQTTSTSVSYGSVQRPLLFPDELMRMDAEAQLVFVENANPCLSDKITWYKSKAYMALAGAGAHAIPR